MQKTTRAGPSPPSARAILDGFVETGRSSSKIRMSSFSLRPPAVGSERTTMHLSLRVVSMAGENVTLRGLTCRGSGATGAGELVAASGQAAPRPWLARSLPRSGSMRSSGARREGRPPGRVAGVRWEQADAEAAVTGSSGGLPPGATGRRPSRRHVRRPAPGFRVHCTRGHRSRGRRHSTCRSAARSLETPELCGSGA